METHSFVHVDVKKVFLDQCVHHPLMYFPAFYMTKEIVTSEGNPNFTKALLQYKDNMKEDMLALWKIWVPATILNFAFMPMWARIPTAAATSMIWTCILSAMRGGDVMHKDDLVGGALRGASFKLVSEGIGEMFSSSVDLDPSLSHICVSAAGPDKVGWVALLAEQVSHSGGNITHSKMVRLGHDFIILMHVSVPPEQVRTIVSSLNSSEDLEPLNIRTSFLTKRQTGRYKKPLVGFRIHCVGQDRPGILAAVSKHVSDANLSVENITTELRVNREGRRDFVINCDCTASHSMDNEDLDAMMKDFEGLKEELNFDILDVLVHQERKG